MAKTTAAPAEKPNGSRKPNLNQADVPSILLSEALRIPLALRDNYALKAASPLDVGAAIGIAPTSGGFRTLTGAAIAFGLTTGGYNATEIGLTELGRRIVAPNNEGDDTVAKREAFERPRVIKEFIERYNGNKMPPKQIAQNVLNGMNVPYEVTERAYDLILAGLNELGYLRDIHGSSFIQRPTGASINTGGGQNELSEPHEDLQDIIEEMPALTPTPPEVPTKPERPNAIFLGHGKNRKPLEQLIKILDEYGIPHKEAIDEANAGRPIPVKVAETMHECGAAILIFTADEQFLDADGNDIWRPSENVVHELGAASVLYDNRIVIFKETDITLASNFSSIGYINFDKDKLNDKGIELFRELVKFKIVNISVAG